MITLNTTIDCSREDFEEKSENDLIIEAIESLIQEAVNHFNKVKTCVRKPDDDCRFFYNKNELDRVLDQINNPDTIWVSEIKDKQGKFYAYRIGRVCVQKKKGVVKY